MRFWLQAEEISSNVTYKFFANNKELSGADVRHSVDFKMNRLKNTFWVQVENIVVMLQH